MSAVVVMTVHLTPYVQTLMEVMYVDVYEDIVVMDVLVKVIETIELFYE